MTARMLGLALAAAWLLAAAAGARTLHVNDGGDDCDAAADHATIQSAVLAAAAGGAARIHVCPGLYEELVLVEGFRHLTLEADPGATVRPPGPLATGAIFEVVDSRKVTIRGFAIDGAGQFSGAGIFVYGVYFRSSSGAIEGNTITGIRPEPLAPSFSHAIHVVDGDPADDVKVKVRIRGNALAGYGQMGIDVADAASLRIQDNVLTGMGPTDQESQLGMILRSVARGRVSGNTVASHWYLPFRQAAGLVLEGADRIRVQGNVLADNDDAVQLSGDADRNRITGNDVAGARFGIRVSGTAADPAERNQVSGNRLAGAGGAGFTALEISDAEGTRVSGNELQGFATFFEDFGTDTRLRKNRCDGAPCP